MNTEELTQQQKAARDMIMQQLRDCADGEAIVDLIVDYYRQGIKDGTKVGIKAMLLEVKKQVDEVVEKIAKAEQPPSGA